MARPSAFALVVGCLLVSCASSSFVPPTPEAAAYRQALLEIREADQAPRNRYVALLRRYDYQPPDSLRLPLAREVLVADSVNLVRFEALVEAHGWPKASEVGAWAARSGFLVIQHADLKTQLRYEPLLRDAVGAGEGEAADLALLTDRILVRQGQPQRYGSQTRTDPETGARSFYPIEDRATLDARRATVGLTPMAEYAREMDVPWPPDD